MTEKRHRVRSAVSPDPCVMFMIYKYIGVHVNTLLTCHQSHFLLYQ